MKKDSLTLKNVQKDLLVVAGEQEYNVSDWRLSYIVPVTALALLLGFLLKNVWIGLAIFSVAAYHIVRLILESKDARAAQRLLREEIQRGAVAVSVETLDHIARETVYEPHSHGRHKHTLKEVEFFYFRSGIRWRVPNVLRHYEWSREYSTTSQMLNLTAVEGNEFYVISLQSNHSVSYAYNTKFFELKEAEFAPPTTQSESV